MFIWDSANIAHIAEHAISTEEAEQVISNDPLDIERQLRNGEARFVHLGETLHRRVLYVVITLRGDDLRVVTAFPANRKARAFYREQKELRDGEADQNP